jgi:hypothetical protein
MKKVALLFALVLMLGCDDSQPAPQVIVNEIIHYITEEDSTPDIVTIHETVYVTEEDTTPDVVVTQEFYSDAADLPMLAWDVGGGDTPMAKKFRDLTEKTTVAMQDAFAVSEAGGAASKFVEFRYFPLRNYIGGLITSNNGATPDEKVDIEAGLAAADDNTYLMNLASSITKSIASNWAVGTGNGGLDTGSVAANTLYAVWLIARSDTDVVDAILSTSFTAPTLTAGDLPNYDKKRLIGAVLTDGTSDILTYTQSGDEFRYDDPVQDVDDTALTNNVFKTGTLSVPPNCKAHIYGYFEKTGTTDAFLRAFIRPSGTSDAITANESFINVQTGTDTVPIASKAGFTMVDASKQIEYALSFTDGTDRATIKTFGFTMLTRREP